MAEGKFIWGGAQVPSDMAKLLSGQGGEHMGERDKPG